MDLKYGWNGPCGHRWNGNTKSFEPIEMEKMTMKEPWEKELDRHDGDDFRAKQPKMIPNPLWCERCDGRGYLVADAEWEPYAVQCSACADRRRGDAKMIPENVEVAIRRLRLLADTALGSLYEVECQREMRNACILLEAAYKEPAVSADTVIAKIEAEARRYAEMYPQSSDGQNTFVIFADWVAGLGASTVPEGSR